jgi:hypothetical protein
MSTGREAFLVRSAYAELDRITPSNAIVQYNPESNLGLQLLIYSQYQLVDAAAPDCETPFGSPDQCPAVQVRLKSIFDPDATENRRRPTCLRRLRVD